MEVINWFSGNAYIWLIAALTLTFITFLIVAIIRVKKKRNLNIDKQNGES